MGNLINNLPQILEKSASLFGVFALVAIVLASVVFLLFGKADPKQKERIFVYMTLFFLALTFSALAAGTLSGYKGGGEAVTTQIEQDPSSINPSLVSLSPNTIERLERYIESKGEAVTQKNKVRVLEEALESYTNPKPVQPTVLDLPSPVSSSPSPLFSQTNKVKEKDFLFVFKGCYRSGQNIDCQVIITNQGEDRRELDLSANYINKFQSAIFANTTRYVANEAKLADRKNADHVSLEMPSNIGVSAKVSFSGIPDEIKKLEAVEFFIRVDGDFPVRFSNVSVSAK